jgi:hypothetical protein
MNCSQTYLNRWEIAPIVLFVPFRNTSCSCKQIKYNEDQFLSREIWFPVHELNNKISFGYQWRKFIYCKVSAFFWKPISKTYFKFSLYFSHFKFRLITCKISPYHGVILFITLLTFHLSYVKTIHQNLSDSMDLNFADCILTSVLINTYSLKQFNIKYL